MFSVEISVYLKLCRPSVFEKNNLSLDVLPVRGPQGCVRPSSTSDVEENKFVSQETWTVQPECLLLATPSLSK